MAPQRPSSTFFQSSSHSSSQSSRAPARPSASNSSSSFAPNTMGHVQSKLSRITGGRSKSRNPLDDIGLPSKGDTRLLDLKTQEAYYANTIERYMAFCAKAGTRDELLRRFSALDVTDDTQPSTPPPQSSSSQTEGGAQRPVNGPTPADVDALQDVIFALRKLREGIVASNRIDAFATQVYIFCIHFGVLIQHPPTYYPAILHALRSFLHNLTTIELKEITGYRVLDAACRRQNLAEAYELKVRHQLDDKEVDTILSALTHDNYVAFRRALKEMDGHKARLAQFAEKEMVMVALKTFRAYHQVDLEFLERSTGKTWKELVELGVGWKLEGTTVYIRAMPGRS